MNQAVNNVNLIAKTIQLVECPLKGTVQRILTGVNNMLK
jgi:hypothetical protein